MSLDNAPTPLFERPAMSLRRHLRPLLLGLALSTAACGGGIDEAAVERIAEAKTRALLSEQGPSAPMDEAAIKKLITTHQAETKRTPQTVIAGAFELKDGEGRIRARLSVNKEGSTELSLLDLEGRPRAQLAVDHRGDSQLLLMNHKRRKRIWLQAIDSQGPSISLADSGGAQVVRLEAPDRHAAALLLQRGSSILRASVQPDGNAELGLGLSSAKERSTLSMSPEGAAGLHLLDAAGKMAAQLPTARGNPAQPKTELNKKTTSTPVWFLTQGQLELTRSPTTIEARVTAMATNESGNLPLARLCLSLLDERSRTVGSSELRVSVALKKRNLDALTRLGKLLAADGRSKEAEQFLDRMRRIDPDCKGIAEVQTLLKSDARPSAN